MAEITTAAYADLRAYILSTWGRLRLYDGSGVLQLSLSATDSRVAWGANVDPLVLTVHLSGADADTVGRTFARVKLFRADDASGAVVLADETFTAATVALSGDTLTCTLSLQVPLIP